MELRYYQTDAINALWKFLYDYNGHPLLALPTGTGKGVIIAHIINSAVQWKGTRVACLTHVKELIRQNYDELVCLNPLLHPGIVSAGLKKKQYGHDIVFGGVGSVVNQVEHLGHRDLLIIDEAHLINHKADTMYRRVIEGLMQINPKLRVIGLTATPYRMGQGLLTNNGLFTDICYDITQREQFEKLINEGYLSKPITKRTSAKIDTENISIVAGEYNQKELEEAANEDGLNYAVCQEMVEVAKNRAVWLIFASGVEHAKNLTQLLNNFGIHSACLHGDLDDEVRDKIITDYKAGVYRALVNYNVATTGFNHPAIDFIGMVRATNSPGLWVQMIGRGTRPSPLTMKKNCLVMDFGRNVERLGPINDVVKPKPKSEGGKAGTPPIRICPECNVYHHATVKVCDNCGYVFPENPDKYDQEASNRELILTEAPQQEWFDVTSVTYSKHIKKDFNQSSLHIPILKVTYVCGIQAFTEFVCLEHSGYTKTKAEAWWKLRMGSDYAPPSIDEALKWTHKLAKPNQILVHVNKKYPEVLSYTWPPLSTTLETTTSHQTVTPGFTVGSLKGS